MFAAADNHPSVSPFSLSLSIYTLYRKSVSVPRTKHDATLRPLSNGFTMYTWRVFVESPETRPGLRRGDGVC